MSNTLGAEEAEATGVRFVPATPVINRSARDNAIAADFQEFRSEPIDNSDGSATMTVLTVTFMSFVTVVSCVLASDSPGMPGGGMYHI